MTKTLGSERFIKNEIPLNTKRGKKLEMSVY